MSWKFYLLALLGGGIGSSIRFAASRYIPFDTQTFAWGTFLVNALGCFFIGWLWVKLNSPMEKSFWIAGIMGGLTTFSGLGLETFRYLNDKSYGLALQYVILSIILGILLIWLGQRIAS